jgi:regulator of cell morphogenesis and NO signaling
MKMADVVHSNYLLLPVISRFGILLGFGEKTVKAVCKKHRIDVEFFMAIANTFSNEAYFPEKKLQSFNVLMIVSYLQKTHAYYRETQVPLVEKLLNALMRNHLAEKNNVKLLKKFFLGYKKELFAHLDREEKTTFPYIKKAYQLFHSFRMTQKERTALSQYSMQVYEEEHSDIDEKLYDLKNILIKYVRGRAAESLYHEVIFELFRLEKDIQDHTRIENNVLMPLVVEMENVLFHIHKKKSMHAHGTAAGPAVHSPEDERHMSGNANLDYRIPSHLKQNGPWDQEDLSQREREVLQLVACGFINKEIADKLYISLHTVISHRKNITRKLQIKTVAGLTIYALLNGLISSKNIS